MIRIAALLLLASAALAQDAPPPAEPAPVTDAPPAAEPAPEAEPIPVFDRSPLNTQALLDAHNQWRAKAGTPPLAWSEEAAAVAQFWANEMVAQGCKPAHNPDRTRKKVFGENIFHHWFSRPYKGYRRDAEAVVGSWGEEVAFYDATTNTCTADADSTCGHYTQLIWSRTQKVGCARAHCPAAELWVCNYYPLGNMQGQTPFDGVQPPAEPAPQAEPAETP